ncbi:Crp/Fnr family transcriptional regulator [Pseudorhodoferax sp.]|uniref:Crp/Fnr family transcriptional regulator n=1 Tax=Pseudorhodoferax sp. TaxID=1993553 RepID=UPI002DD6458C|nr:Crp/Fnr family transcriptional regulator [Pseudorhodoferax sp.]
MDSSLDAVAHAFCANTAHPQSVRALAALGTPRGYRTKAKLLHETDRGDTLFVVMEGRVRAFGHDPQEREITFGYVGPGDYFGEMALDGGPRSATVEALEPTVCALVSRDALLAYIGRQPSFALELLAKVTRRARMATNSARNLAFIEVYSRLARVLGEVALPQDDGRAVLPEDLSLQDIAQRVGCSRDMLSRILKDLQAVGYLERPDGRIVLRAPLPSRW